MEHPFLVEEYVFPQAQREPKAPRGFDAMVPAPESAVALPPFPNLLLTPGDPQYADYLGHSFGGGYGLLARSHGLTCDNLQQVTLIDVQAGTPRSPICSGLAEVVVEAVSALPPSSYCASFP